VRRICGDAIGALVLETLHRCKLWTDCEHHRRAHALAAVAGREIAASCGTASWIRMPERGGRAIAGSSSQRGAIDLIG
jgi:hypothetical protein